MNVAAFPKQAGLEPEVNATATLGEMDVNTDIVIPVEVAVVGLAQDKLLVKIHVTICPLVSVELVNVELFVPAFTPFTCH